MNILVVKTTSMGDVIHTLPALTDAVKHNNSIKFDWVVEENFSEIPVWHSAVNRVIPVAIRRWRKNPIKFLKSIEFRNFKKKLRACEYDHIIDAQGLLKSSVISKLAKGPCYGMSYKTVRERLAALFYQDKYDIPKDQHAITRIRMLFAKALGYRQDLTPPDYGIANNFQKNGNGNYLVFIHGTAREEKCWPVAQWQALAKLVGDNGYNVKIPWGNKKEEDRAKQIAEQSSKAQVLPKSSLTEIAKILVNASAIVAVDTGLSHLAAALNVPTVVLYGPTDPKLIGTMGENQKHVVAKDRNLSSLDFQEVWQALYPV